MAGTQDTWKIFRSQFFTTLAIALVISGLIFGVDSLFHNIHASNTATTAQEDIVQNHFWQALDGTRPADSVVAGNQGVTNFIRDMRPLINSAKKSWHPGLSSTLPSSITSVRVSNAQYGDIAYAVRTPIFGFQTGDNTDLEDINAYKEDGKFDQGFFINGVQALVSGSAADRNGWTNQPVPHVGPHYASFPVWVYILWVLLITNIAYIGGRTDFEAEKIYGLKVNIVDLSEAPFGKVLVSVLCVPISLFSWLSYAYTLHAFKAEQRSLMKRLEDPTIPMSEELKQARQILAKAAKSKMSHLPEVQQLISFAEQTVKSLDQARHHAAENAARKDAFALMNDVVPLAQAAKKFHSELHEDMKTHTEEHMSILKRQMLELEAGDHTENPQGS